MAKQKSIQALTDIIQDHTLSIEPLEITDGWVVVLLNGAKFRALTMREALENAAHYVENEMKT